VNNIDFMLLRIEIKHILNTLLFMNRSQNRQMMIKLHAPKEIILINVIVIPNDSTKSTWIGSE